MAALLSNEIHNTDKIGEFVAECHRMGIEILPPDVNAAWLRFAPEPTPSGALAIRYGLAAIKNVGVGAMDQAIAERERAGKFSSLDDFSNRLDSKVVNKRILENLAKAGAMDWTGEARASMVARLEQVTASASSAQRDRATGQGALFDTMDFIGGGSGDTQVDHAPVEEWSKEERLEHEKELLGFYVTGHPLDRFRNLIDSDRYCQLGALDDLEVKNPRDRFAFAGMIRSVEHKMTKSGKAFGVLVLEDFTGSGEVLLWSESYLPARDAGLLAPGRVIRLKAGVQADDRTGARKLTGSDVKELKPARAAANASGPLELTLFVARTSPADLEAIRSALRAHPGDSDVLLHFQNSAGRRATVTAGPDFKVKRSPTLDQALGRWIDL
jgi:DNA polymerase-3 subunit alpha